MLPQFQLISDSHFGRINVPRHCIKLVDDSQQSVQLRPYQARPKRKQFEKVEIQSILSQKVIEPTKTEWAAPIIISQKKHGRLGFCIYYLKLDDIIKHNLCQIPRMNKCIAFINKVTVFSFFVSNSRPGQIEIGKAGKDYTAFSISVASYISSPVCRLSYATLLVSSNSLWTSSPPF